MSYPSVDQLQKVLSESVFRYAKDKKKAAGRALGTLVEVITFYVLKAWDFERFIAIERSLPECFNDHITHNVEYSLHPSSLAAELEFSRGDLPLSVAKIMKGLAEHGIIVGHHDQKSNQLLTSDGVLRNACTIAEDKSGFLVATLAYFFKDKAGVHIHRLITRPFAIVECKRVGIEEGMRKGPQTIEKAKQGAYVARTVSSLQKIRFPTGEIGGVFATVDGKLLYKPYDAFLREIVSSTDAELLRRFILTVGVVSNHGNWFTSDDRNKELRVLAQSYDWLLFLTDQGLAEFIQDLILHPARKYEPVRESFLRSYRGKSGANRFTKVRMAYSADQVLQDYFSGNLTKVEAWFNVISPPRQGLDGLRHELSTLAAKNWTEIHR